jgi:methionyl-tRNA synthetase
MKKFYTTTPIYYVNAEPHIGHTYTTVAADVLARFHRMIGDKTFFLTGTDEHGAKIAEKAEEAGASPIEFTNGVAAKFQFIWRELNISNDRFIRTTEDDHKKAVQKALQFMYNKGDVYLGKYEGLYCQGCEQFKNEKDLVNGLCPDHKTKPVQMVEESYMFKMSKYADEILKKIENDEIEIRPVEKKNEIISFYKNEGLKDVSFSRKNVKWGIPIPWDESHTVYVWADAFLNYLTGLNWDGSAGSSPEMWPVDIQLMSKDILRIHATIWPAMLLSLGLPLLKKIFVHGFFLVDGQKMSKSIGNVISPEDLITRYGVDAARYLLMSATSFGHDGDIGWKFFDEKYNADLANGLGNLVARSVTLYEKMQEAGIKMQNNNAELENWEGHAFSHGVNDMWNLYQKALKDLKIDLALNLAREQVIGFLDSYITTTKPWALIKNKDERAGVVMYNILERLRHCAFMLWPFMPETAEKIWESLGLNPAEEMKKDFKEAIKWGGLPEEITVKKGESLFPRLS